MQSKFIAKLNPLLILRLGLAFTLLYAAINMLISPDNWMGFVPAWLGNFIDPYLFLKIHSIFELLLGVVLVFGWQLKWVALIAFLDMLSILVFYGIDNATFRDVGLASTALVLSLFAFKENKNPEN